MRDLPVAMLLAPVLVAQSKIVRKRTPSLPEAAGVRAGVSGSGKKLKLMILGDSAAAGVGVEFQEQALCGQLVSRLQQHFNLDWELVAEKGATTATVLSWVPTLKKQNYDVIVVSLGVNDVTGGVTKKNWLRQQEVLIQELENRFLPKQIILTQVPLMGEFRALPHPLRWCVGLQSKRFNQVAKTRWQTHQCCEFLEPPFEIDPALLASDLFHPGAPAYTLWAQAVAEKVGSKFDKMNSLLM